MASRYLLESSSTDGYLLEDGSGVLLLEEDEESETTLCRSYRRSATIRARRRRDRS